MTLDLPALRKRYKQLIGDGAAEKWHDFADQRYEVGYAFSMKGADWKLAALCVNAFEALIRAAEERDALLAAAEAVCRRIPRLSMFDRYEPEVIGQQLVMDAEDLVEAIRLAKEPR